MGRRHYNPRMSKRPHNPNPAGRKGNPVSLHPLTPEQALGGLLKVKLSDVRKLEAAEKRKGRKGK
jgi:hypothetical protein